MVRLNLATALLAVTGAAYATRGKAPNVLPGAYIVEYEDGHDGNALLKSIQDDTSKRMDLDFQLFKGASIQFKDLKNAAERAEQVASMPAVKNLWPVHVYSIPEHTVHSVGSPSAAEYRKRPTRPMTPSRPIL